MQKKTSHRQLIPLLKTAVNTLTGNPIILYPICISVFIQLLALEVLYFAPRFPLSVFFGPVIKRIWGEAFLHYPFNFILLPKLFYYAQILIYFFIGSFLNAIAISIIAAINSERKITFKSALKETLSSYIHIFIAAVISFYSFFLLSNLYKVLINKMILIKEGGKVLLFVKKVAVLGEPYVNLLLGIIATTLFVFVVPVIVIEKKKIIAALLLNFKNLWKSFWFMFSVVLMPTLFYIPVLLLRSNISAIADNSVPGIQLLVIAVSVIITLLIDATVFTATTTYYLLKKENT